MTNTGKHSRISTILVAVPAVVMSLAAAPILLLYSVLYPVGFVDMQFKEMHPKVTAAIDWGPWRAASDCKELQEQSYIVRKEQEGHKYSAFRKGEYDTLFHRFQIFQGRCALHQPEEEYLILLTTSSVKNGRLYTAMVAATILPILLAGLFLRWKRKRTAVSNQ